ncbi:hypothetical protein EAI_03076, partial [Harpegnathos saltator]
IDKIIKRESVADIRKTAMDISRKLRDENLADVSRSIISRRLKEVDFLQRAGVKKPLISAKNKKTR